VTRGWLELAKLAEAPQAPQRWRQDMTPTPDQVADAIVVATMGGDLGRLAEVCRHVADRHDEDSLGRRRLQAAAEALDWAGQLLAVLDGPGIDGDLCGCR
jgi:hypothetical protein